MNITVRDAVPDDCSKVLCLIKELAEYEKAPNEVIINESILREYGFGKNKFFNLFVSEINHQVIGMALCYPKFSTWKGMSLFLEDIIVSEKFRGKGVGKKLFEHVIRYGKKNHYYRLEWQVLDWNIPAIHFYKKFNAEITSEWLNGRIILPDFIFPDNL